MTLNRRLMARLLTALAVGSPAAALAETKPADDTAKLAFFEKKIRPMLVEHCHACHSAETKPAGGLRVDDHKGLLTGGNTGAAVVPGNPAKSLLLTRTSTGDAKRRMPVQGEHLSEEQLADLKTWIADGAVWPKPKIPASLGKGKPEYDQLKKDHWAWQPLKQPAVPAVKDSAWAKDDLDRFVLAKLEEKKLPPVADADKTTLIRRITFDLTGLPPAPAEIDAFVKDGSPDAFTKVVDRLLASPAFGERWGRHWLDVARYGESTGPSRNIPYPHAWKYRDYVIDSVNADVPYNRFITEQVAGDLLPAASPAERDRLLTATGFLALGVKDVNQRFKVRFLMDNVDEQVDAVTRSTLALTVSCARCHDHKFDPIPTTDYYALAGIFTSTDNCAGVRNKMGGGGLDYYDPSMLVKLSSTAPPPDPEKVKKLEAELAVAKKAWDEIRGTPKGVALAPNGQPTQRPFRLKYEALLTEFNNLTDPAAAGHAVHGVRDGKTIADTEVRLRGEAEKLGPVVPRGFLSVLNVPEVKGINPAQSGRLELAKWLTSPNNPLASRVAVNRVWQHLFGRGIVSTSDNFGINGDVPANPELLDHLAGRFVQDGWSVKKLVRAVVLSRSYQLGNDTTPAHLTADPANKLIWRHTPRRLDAEEIRDAALQVVGTLDRSRPAASPAKELRMVEMRDNGPEARNMNEAADKTEHRSVYLPLLRGVTPKSLAPFDPVDQTLVSGNRETTNVPGQALFLLNSAFVRQHSLLLAEKLLKERDKTDVVRIETAYRLAFGRRPTAKETDRANAFIGEYESSFRQQPAPVEKPKAEPKTPAKKDAPAAPIIDPDQIDQTGEAVVEADVKTKDARTAAWLAFVQALIGSAEFRYVR
ncbi:DUF1553 domain-containing protein [Zavarzinella formosa]|uniref:DUF1553 domain-containing protein n=1 Tax=Zavarzinella formosa TaxID=360055 RepID=UPI00031539B3|nr:PSD1 and planctomycete cytochrome C domain-containing protein [Zavarzinella formosa]